MLPREKTYKKDKSYEHSPLPTPSQTLLLQWKNAKQCKKWENKQISWDQLISALGEHQKTGDAAMLRWQELEGDELEHTSADPMDVLMDQEQEEIQEEARQYRLGLLLRSITKRQRKALEWKALGLTERQIAKKMRTSQKTINRDITKIDALARVLKG